MHGKMAIYSIHVPKNVVMLDLVDFKSVELSKCVKEGEKEKRKQFKSVSL